MVQNVGGSDGLAVGRTANDERLNLRGDDSSASHVAVRHPDRSSSRLRDGADQRFADPLCAAFISFFFARRGTGDRIKPDRPLYA
jgi:hypothetical protein